MKLKKEKTGIFSVYWTESGGSRSIEHHKDKTPERIKIMIVNALLSELGIQMRVDK